MFEYKVEDTWHEMKWGDGFTMESLTGYLNKQAQDGWELYLIHGEHLSGSVFFFRREITSTESTPFHSETYPKGARYGLVKREDLENC